MSFEVCVSEVSPRIYNAVPATAPLRSVKFACLDLETTGLDPWDDRIIEIAVVSRDFSRARLVNPNRPIPPETTQIHGITNADVRNCPTFQQIAKSLAERLDGLILTAYNAPFDREFLAREFARADIACPAAEQTWIDPLVLARELQREDKGFTLARVASRCGVTVHQAHRAEDDARVTLAVLDRLLELCPAKTYGELLEYQVRAQQRQILSVA